MPIHDPAGPVAVGPDVAMATVRGALGAGRRLVRPDGAFAWAALVTRDRALAETARAQGIPVVSAADDPALCAQLRAFDDGILVSTREAELLAWIHAIRLEEERNQRDHERHVHQRIEVLQARVDELTVYAENLQAHLAAIEDTRAWRILRRVSDWKNAARRWLSARSAG